MKSSSKRIVSLFGTAACFVATLGAYLSLRILLPQEKGEEVMRIIKKQNEKQGGRDFLRALVLQSIRSTELHGLVILPPWAEWKKEGVGGLFIADKVV